ncbi:MAG: hypothetical protein HRU03_08290 [Nanoarchaeales archaeon]|nr:hypothetical protein [Nanoarchaeales archaeon]
MIKTVCSLNIKALKNQEHELETIMFFSTQIYELEQLNNIIYFFNEFIKNSKDKKKILNNLINLKIDEHIKNILKFYIKYNPNKITQFIEAIPMINTLKLDLSIKSSPITFKPLSTYTDKEIKTIINENSAQVLEIYKTFLIESFNKKENNLFYEFVNRFKKIKSKTIENEYIDKKEKKNKKEYNSDKNQKYEIEKKDKVETYVNQFRNLLEKVKGIYNSDKTHKDRTIIYKLDELFSKVLFEYYDIIKNEKIDEILNKKFNIENVNKELIDKEFLEIYQMSTSPNLLHNKHQANELLKNYLLKNTYPNNKNLLNSYPYNLYNNKLWLSKQEFNTKQWFSENKKTYKNDTNEITIYHELNPIKICFMGNWFIDSCLGFNKLTNFYSAFTNSIDINKSVFYITSKNEMIARVLCCFTKENKLVRFRMYYTKHSKYNPNEIFNKYILELTNICNIETTDLTKVNEYETLETEEWYFDGNCPFK